MPVRILVDQSGYDLLNVGDAAMLQSCVQHLGALWPGADIAVICHDGQRLEQYCPGTTQVPAALGGPGSVPGLPEKVRLGFGQVHKMVRPYTSLSRGRSRHQQAPRSLTGAIRWADVVVASGGGYLNDTWWWHGFGVLSVLDLAQRLGRPTAMFGQGIGPLTHPALRRQARRVLPRLHVLGLREGVAGLPLARSLGVAAACVVVTGDDALDLAGSAATAPSAPTTPSAAIGSGAGDALGVNVRVTGYAGVDGPVASRVGTTLARAVARWHATVIGLPVSRYEPDSDLASIRSLWPGRLPAGSIAEDLSTPLELAAAAARCRAVVTGSYHAAVFALAAGVPTVCLSSSDYYNAKFAGIADLFPDATEVVPLGGRDLERRLEDAIGRAWGADERTRRSARERATTLAEASKGLYQRFADLVNEGSAAPGLPALRDEIDRRRA
ncbi:MAG: polysaccharide pyruvyl transferase family protein [Actinomycetota bacterium]